jgi:glycerophosphoryl diester phosphodiesterase
MKFSNSLFLLIVIFLTLYFSLFGQEDRAQKLSSKLLGAERDYVLVIAHRGDWRNAPENSIEAIRSAVAMGADMVEIDVRKTKDNQLVIMHDETIDRTTNGKGQVSEWALDSLKTLNLKNGQGRVTRFKIPTLEEALLEAKGKILVNLDKSYDYFDQVHDVLMKTETIDQVVMKAKKPYEVVKNEFGKYLDKVIFMPIVDLTDERAPAIIQDYIDQDAAVAFELVFSEDKYLTQDIINTINDSGKRIWINSLWDNLNGGHSDDLALTDTESSFGWIINNGATLIQTDRPALLLDYLDQNELHN